MQFTDCVFFQSTKHTTQTKFILIQLSDCDSKTGEVSSLAGLTSLKFVDWANKQTDLQSQGRFMKLIQGNVLLTN